MKSLNKKLGALLLFVVSVLMVLPVYAACSSTRFVLEDGRSITAPANGPDYAVGNIVHLDQYSQSDGGLTVILLNEPMVEWYGNGKACAITFPAEVMNRSDISPKMFRPTRRR